MDKHFRYWMQQKHNILEWILHDQIVFGEIPVYKLEDLTKTLIIRSQMGHSNIHISKPKQRLKVRS